MVFVGGLGDFSDEMDWIRGGFCRLECESGVMEESSGSRAIGSKGWHDRGRR